MSLTNHRLGENGLLPFRTKRIFNVDQNWFFAMRGGKDCGPFDNFQDAEMELNLYLSEFKNNFHNSELKHY